MNSRREDRKETFLQNLEEEVKTNIRGRRKIKQNLYLRCLGMDEDDVVSLQPLNDSHEFADIKICIKTIIWYFYFYFL